MWLNGQIPVYSAKAYRLTIEAVRGKTSLSDIAIDDIEFIPRTCKLMPENATPVGPVTDPIITTTRTLRPVSSLDCNFETSFCKWYPKLGNIEWKRAQGKQSPNNAGPLNFDHTLGTSDGWYVFADIAGKISTESAQMELDILTGQKCMEFYYFINSGSTYTLSVNYKWSDIGNTTIWSRSNMNGNFWQLGRINIQANSLTYSLVFDLRGNFESATVADKIALDDIFISEGECREGTQVNDVCSFSNDDFCGLQVNNTSEFKWLLYLPKQDAVPQSASPLPINDHTTSALGSGYAYVKSSGYPPNSTATLQSPVYTPPSLNLDDSGRCLEFYYYIQGTDSIKLNVKAEQSSESNPGLKILMWSRQVDHSFFWWKGEIDVQFLFNYSFIYEAVVGNNSANGVAALDDITLKNGPCSSSAGLCDFENNDFCNWQNLKLIDDFDWTINSGPTSTLGTGPSIDHTLSTTEGKYIYIESSYPAETGWKAQLTSEALLNDEEGCMTFWYHMFGSGIGELNLYLTENQSQSLIWQLAGEAGETWMQGLAPFRSKLLHNLLFEGVVGRSDRGDIALDDLFIKREACKIQPEYAQPQVQSPAIIDCNFEDQTFCNWKNDDQASMKWIIGQGPSENSGRTGPKSGALGSTYYAYINSRKNAKGKNFRNFV